MSRKSSPNPSQCQKELQLKSYNLQLAGAQLNKIGNGLQSISNIINAIGSSYTIEAIKIQIYLTCLEKQETTQMSCKQQEDMKKELHELHQQVVCLEEQLAYVMKMLGSPD